MTIKINMVKALVLLSGGLDSMLAARILMEQDIEVTGASFKSNFFGTAKAKKVAKQLGIELMEIDFSFEHFIMVKKPKHGYGKNMNPCIDCHAMMLEKAREIMEREGFDFVATGEVLGERPMSQNAKALKIVEKESGLIGRLIRPLSAKLLDESDLEKAGLVNREKLLDISGRSRKPQLALVKKYGIKEYASPGGGCLLTDPVFSKKLRKMFEYWPEGDGRDAKILKYGRTFWLKDKEGKNILLVMGREKEDNEQLEKLVKPGDVLIKFIEVAGPTSLIRGLGERKLEIGESQIEAPKELKMSEFRLDEKKSDKEILDIAMRLTGYYATKERGKKVKFKIQIINN